MAQITEWSLTATLNSVTGDVTSVDPLQVKTDGIDDAVGFDSEQEADKAAADILSKNSNSTPTTIPPRIRP